jgi:hypothetical protein
MPSNIEIKAVLPNQVAAEAAAARLSNSSPINPSEDVFLRCDGARLKLRIPGPDRGELIRYERTDVAENRYSRYVIARTSDPEVLHRLSSPWLHQTADLTRKYDHPLNPTFAIIIFSALRAVSLIHLAVPLRRGRSPASLPDPPRECIRAGGFRSRACSRIFPEVYYPSLG